MQDTCSEGKVHSCNRVPNGAILPVKEEVAGDRPCANCFTNGQQSEYSLLLDGGLY